MLYGPSVPGQCVTVTVPLGGGKSFVPYAAARGLAKEVSAGMMTDKYLRAAEEQAALLVSGVVRPQMARSRQLRSKCMLLLLPEAACPDASLESATFRIASTPRDGLLFGPELSSSSPHGRRGQLGFVGSAPTL